MPRLLVSTTEPQRTPVPGGTVSTAATHSLAAIKRLETPAGDGHGSRLSGHIAAEKDALPESKQIDGQGKQT